MHQNTDRKAARAAAAGIATVAATAAVISFSHVKQLALGAGETELASWLLPISIDGAIVAAVSVILADSRAGRRPAGLTWLLLAIGLAGSLAANIASAEPTLTARAVAAWPPIALALGIEVMASMLRRRDGNSARELARVHVARPAGSGRTPVPPAVNGTARHPAGDRQPEASARPAGGGSASLPPAANGTVRHPPGGRQVGDADAVALIRQLDAESSDGQVSRLTIQQQLGCGGSKAARLADLARQVRPEPAGRA